MSGHSKWHNIKHKKAKEDAKKGLVFTKVSKEISISVKNGGADPGMNVNLRLLLLKAKECNMPKENIERAIKKGSGQLESVAYDSVAYEGYAPEGVAVIVQALTDNRNRTISDLRHIFNRHNGRIVENGAVSWMFNYVGTIEVENNGKSEDAMLEELLDLGILDLKYGDEESLVLCDVASLDETRAVLEEKGYVVKSMEPAWVPKNPVNLGEEAQKNVAEFLEKLEDLDDVKDVFANLE